MKIAVNKCYGGFTLSDEAKYFIAKELYGDSVFPYVREDLREGGYTVTRLTGPVTNSEGHDWRKDIIFFIEDPMLDTLDDPLCLGYDQMYFDLARDSDVLIKAIETLGDRAQGPYSKFEIVELPDDGRSWEITDYDGIENVISGHNLRRD